MMKKIIESNWGDWKTILNNEEIVGTGKVVLFEFLEKNPSDFKNAFVHAEPKSVKQLIKTIEAIKWNDELKKEVLLKKPNNSFSMILEEKTISEEFPLLASKAMKRELLIQPTEFENQFFKNKLERKTFFNSKHFSIKKENKNEYWLNFELGKGTYATIFLKYLENWLKK
jgi:tRNA(Glu) U13 pseudouridine synthase TruD